MKTILVILAMMTMAAPLQADLGEGKTDCMMTRDSDARAPKKVEPKTEVKKESKKKEVRSV